MIRGGGMIEMLVLMIGFIFTCFLLILVITAGEVAKEANRGGRQPSIVPEAGKGIIPPKR